MGMGPLVSPSREVRAVLLRCQKKLQWASSALCETRAPPRVEGMGRYAWKAAQIFSDPGFPTIMEHQLQGNL